MEPTKTPPHSRELTLSAEEHQALEIYRTNLQAIYTLLQDFLPLEQIDGVVKLIAERTFRKLPESGYKDFARIFFFRIVFETLSENEAHFKPSFPFENLFLDELFAHKLKAELHFTEGEIASICATSVGTIRTRLEKAERKTQVVSSSKVKNLFSHQTEVPRSLIDLQPQPIFVKEDKRWSFNISNAPWYYKIVFEGLLATTLVLSIIFSVPRIKRVYEFWVERRLDLYSLTEFNSDSLQPDAPAPNAQEAQTAQNPPSASLAMPDTSTGVTSSLGSAPLPSGSSSSSTAADTLALNEQPAPGPAKISSETEFVGKESERLSSDKIYRILIQTDSLESAKASVVKILSLQEHQYAGNNLGPSDLPGGIIFDVFVPFKNYKPIIDQLGSVGETKIIITRSKERGTSGKARVKIWLQRI